MQRSLGNGHTSIPVERFGRARGGHEVEASVNIEVRNL